jgi:LysM repeat protein
MQALRQFGSALTLALISAGLVLGSLSLSLVEFAPSAQRASTDVLLPSPALLTATSTLPPPLESPTATVTPLPTNTPPPPPSCQPPLDWYPIQVQLDDSLETLSARYRISADELRAGNCLPTNNLVPGSTIYVPPVATSTVAACVPGAVDWVKSYRTQPGDTFYKIASYYGISLTVLMRVNCRTSSKLLAGELLWVPNIPTRTPTPTLIPGGLTFTPYPTLPLTETALPFTLTPEPTSTPIPTTPTPIPTNTPEPTLTSSPTAFPTP